MKEKYYYYELNKYPFAEFVEDYFYIQKQENTDIEFCYLMDEQKLLDDDIENQIQIIIKTIEKNNIKNYSISFKHHIDDKINNNLTCEKLKQLSIKYPNIVLGIEDENKTWTYEEIKNSNNQLDEIVENIKQQNFSPVEALMSAYLEIIKRQYRDGEKSEQILARSIYGVLNSDKIVCVGYCELLREIVARLNLENVNVYLNDVATDIINERHSLHRNLIIYVKDEKYDIDGYYYFDPTWDSTGPSKEKCLLNFFMLPLSEIKNINEYTICQDYVSNEIKYKTKVYSDLKVYNWPEENNKSSVYYSGAIFSNELQEKLKNDTKYLQSLHNSSNSQQTSSAHAQFEALNTRSEHISNKKMLKIISNVVSKNNKLDIKQQQKLFYEIIKDNADFTKLCFDSKANTYFVNIDKKLKCDIDENILEF